MAFIMTETEEAKAPVFLAEVNLGGRAFIAKAGTKKMAKNKVSEQILTAKFGMDFTAVQEAAASAAAAFAAPVVDEEGQKLAERVMVLVMERFYSLTNMGLANTARRKVLAGIVMTIKEVRSPGEKVILRRANGGKENLIILNENCAPFLLGVSLSLRFSFYRFT